jgi:hypothetical protein
VSRSCGTGKGTQGGAGSASPPVACVTGLAFQLMTDPAHRPAMQVASERAADPLRKAPPLPSANKTAATCVASEKDPRVVRVRLDNRHCSIRRSSYKQGPQPPGPARASPTHTYASSGQVHGPRCPCSTISRRRRVVVIESAFFFLFSSWDLSQDFVPLLINRPVILV